MTYTITNNNQFGSVEISFNEKPSEEIRAALKAQKFRWHSVKKIWYGYADAETLAAILGGEAPAQAPKGKRPAVKAAAKATAQDHVRIYWNGIKIDGGKLIRCCYSFNDSDDKAPHVSIYARDYNRLPRDLFTVENASDSYSDYFEEDHAHLGPDHPLYKYFRYAAEKAQARMDRPYCEKLRETLSSGRREPWPGHYDALRGDLARREEFLAQFEKEEDPGQPTAEDLAEIDRQKQEAENARKAAEHEKELRQRENYLCQRTNGRHLIQTEAEAHPIQDGQPVVLINWSEHPAFYDFADDELRLSIRAAEKILGTLDREQNETRETELGCGWYYKTKFTITGTDENGEEFSYTGRYDLGDNDGGLIQHIRSFGEYYLTHDNFGHVKAQADETNETVQFADYLSKFVA